MARSRSVVVQDRPSWHDQASCSGVDPALFFYDRGADIGQVRIAKMICHHCEVKVECLEAGLTERFGIWGGLSEKERREYRRLQSAS